MPTYVSAGTGATADTAALDVPYPATVNANDLLVLHHIMRDGGHTVTTPGGWGVLQATIDNTFTIFGSLYGKVAAGTETGNLTVSITGGTAITVARIYRFTSNAVTSYSEGLSNSGIGDASATVTDAGVTTLGANRLACNFVATSGDTPIGDFTGETGGDWVEAAEFDATGVGQIQLQTATIASAGTINGGTLTSGGGQYLVFGLALLPVAVTSEVTFPRHALGTGRW